MAYVEYNTPKVPNGYQALPVGATCVKLTVPTGTRYARAKATAGMRWRDDGPSAVNNTTGGISLFPKEELEIDSKEKLDAFRVIATGTTGMLEVAYYKA